jgi:hypothetical protein
MARLRTKSTLLALLVSGFAVFAGVAFAASAGKDPADSYSVLGKAEKPSDRLTKDGRELARRVSSSFQIRPGDSRRTRLKTGHGVWLIPGKSSVCLFIEDHSGGVKGTCNRLSGAITGALYLAEYRQGKTGSLRRITGALPDDGSNVSLVGANGHERKLDLKRNTYGTHLSKDGAAGFKPQSINYEIDGKSYSIKVSG